MTQLHNYFIYSPGGENETGNDAQDKAPDNKEGGAQAPKKDEDTSIIKKIKDALQDWSNKDEADLDFDDTRV